MCQGNILIVNGNERKMISVGVKESPVVGLGQLGWLSVCRMKGALVGPDGEAASGR